jgi:hypothetical protein
MRFTEAGTDCTPTARMSVPFPPSPGLTEPVGSRDCVPAGSGFAVAPGWDCGRRCWTFPAPSASAASTGGGS